jgi:serine/threonine protein kinase
LLVLEYADNGTLRKYLKKNFDTFRWERQLNFAKEIASAVVCLHYNGIIHRDLVSLLFVKLSFMGLEFVINNNYIIIVAF